MPTGPVIVAEQLPDELPDARRSRSDFRAAFQKVNSAPTTDAFSAYSFDAWLVFADAARARCAKAEPGTPEFRVALRDAICRAPRRSSARTASTTSSRATSTASTSAPA